MTRKLRLLSLLAGTLTLTISCSSDKVQERVERRDAALSGVGENVKIRQQGRDERIREQREWLLR